VKGADDRVVELAAGSLTDDPGRHLPEMGRVEAVQGTAAPPPACRSGVLRSAAMLRLVPSTAAAAAAALAAALLTALPTSAGAAPTFTLGVSPNPVGAAAPFSVASTTPCPPPAGSSQPTASVTTFREGPTLVPGPTATASVDSTGNWSLSMTIGSAGVYVVDAQCLPQPGPSGAYATYQSTTLDVATRSVGYYVAGTLVTFGDQFGDAAAVLPQTLIPPPLHPIVGVAAEPTTGLGYWTVASDGGVFAWGTAPFEGSAGNLHLAAPIVGMTPTRSGQGYWLVGQDGGVFTFGDAPFYGSGVGEDPSPVVGIARTGFHTTPGVLIAHADGAVWKISAGSATRVAAPIPGLAAPIVGIAATPSEMGWYLVGADGGVFTFGDAVFAGSMGAVHLQAPVTGITARQDGGYWLVGNDEGIFSFGGAPFLGTLAGTAHAGFGFAVGIAATPDPTSPTL